MRPALFEVYHDPLANIAYRITAGAGVGYYVFDQTGLEWTLFVGPGYQYTRFANVETNESGYADTPAGVLNSKFKADITNRLTFIQNWQSILTDHASGQYTHHAITTLEFEIKQCPQTKANGDIPEKSDLYLNVGWGVRF